ncbi:hypothetical protein AB4030_00340 [Terrabacter sp. 2YAF2]
MTVRGLGAAPEWSAFLDVSNSALQEAMSALQRDAIDAAADYARFARRVKDAPNEELQDVCRRIFDAMSLVVVEIGVTRRALVREVRR